MGTKDEQNQALKEAEAARDALGAALTEAGVTLPSLRVDLMAYCDERHFALVELGRCNIQTAHALATALRKEQDRPSTPSS